MEEIDDTIEKDEIKRVKRIKKPNEKFYLVFRVLGNILFVPFVVIIILSSILMFRSKIRNEVPSLFGYSAVVILSSSMEPNFSKDDVVLVKKINVNDLKIGDIIAFYEYYELTDEEAADLSVENSNIDTTIGNFLGDGAENEYQQKAAKSYSRVIFHRIVAKTKPSNPNNKYHDKWFFKTQGDNNAEPDSRWVMQDFVVGIGDISSKNNFMGQLFQFCTTTPGVIVFVVLPAAILIILLTIDIIGENRKQKFVEQLESQNQELQTEILSEISGEKKEKQKKERVEKAKQEIMDHVLSENSEQDKLEKPNIEPKVPVAPKVPPKAPVAPKVPPKIEGQPNLKLAKQPKPMTEKKPKIENKQETVVKKETSSKTLKKNNPVSSSKTKTDKK